MIGTRYSWGEVEAPGLADRMRLLRIFGEIGARRPEVRAWAIGAVRSAGLPSARNRRAVASAVLRAAQRMVWAREIGEQFWRPDKTIAAGGGDCDDLSMVVFAGLRSLGVPAADLEYRFLRHREGGVQSWRHVFVAVRLPEGRWMPLEPSLPLRPGQSPLNLVRAMRPVSW